VVQPLDRPQISLAALGFALGAPALAQDADHTEIQDRLSSAGFEAPRILDEVEVARVTGEDGNTFYVIGGLDWMAGGLGGAGMGTGVGTGTDTTTLGATGTEPAGDLTGQVQQQQATDPAAPDTGIGTDTEVADDPLAPDTGTTTAADPLGTEGATGIGDTAEDPLAPDTGTDTAADPLAPDTETDTAADPLAPDTGTGIAADPAAPAGQDGMMAGGMGMSLEDQLSEAGFDDYEILAEARVAEVLVGQGDAQTIFVITGIEDAAE
jgi:hypothetical protein